MPGYVDLEFPKSCSLPIVPTASSDGPSGMRTNKNKMLRDKTSANTGSSSGLDTNSASSLNRAKSLQPPNLALYKNFLSDKVQPSTFRRFKESGTLVLGSTVKNTVNRKSRDFVTNSGPSHSEQDTTELLPIYTSSHPTMTAVNWY